MRQATLVVKPALAPHDPLVLVQIVAVQFTQDQDNCASQDHDQNAMQATHSTEHYTTLTRTDVACSLVQSAWSASVMPTSPASSIPSI
jgi:hypothetical protein